MNHDLRTLIQDSVDTVAREHEAGAPPVEQEADLLWARVARRRAVRTGAGLLTAAAATAAVVVGLTTVLAPPAPTPPATPGPTSVAPTPDPDPEPSPDPEPTSSPEPAPEPEPEPTGDAGTERHPALPPALPLDAATLAATDASWQLVVHVEPWPSEDDPVPPVAFLVDPAGQLYEMDARLPLTFEPYEGSPHVMTTLLQWLPGTSLVTELAIEPSPNGELHLFRVADLLTGEVLTTFPPDVRPRFLGDGTTDLLDMPGGSALVRYAVTGEELARTGQPGSDDWFYTFQMNRAVSPDRSTAALLYTTGLQLFDARTLSPGALLPLPYPPEERSCYAHAWVDDTTAAVQCQRPVVDSQGFPNSDSREWWLVGRDTAPVRIAGPEEWWRPYGVVQGRLLLSLDDMTGMRDAPAPRSRAVGPDGTGQDIPGPGDGAGIREDGSGRLLMVTQSAGHNEAQEIVRRIASVDPFTGVTAWEITTSRESLSLLVVDGPGA